MPVNNHTQETAEFAVELFCVIRDEYRTKNPSHFDGVGTEVAKVLFPAVWKIVDKP